MLHLCCVGCQYFAYGILVAPLVLPGDGGASPLAQDQDHIYVHFVLCQPDAGLLAPSKFPSDGIC